MARKVGFDRPDTKLKKLIAGRYLNEFRAKATKQRTSALKPRPSVKRNWIVIIFMLVWITLWTGGILLALGVLLSGESDGFIAIWLVAACIGWGVAVFVIIQQNSTNQRHARHKRR